MNQVQLVFSCCWVLDSLPHRHVKCRTRLQFCVRAWCVPLILTLTSFDFHCSFTKNFACLYALAADSWTGSRLLQRFRSAGWFGWWWARRGCDCKANVRYVLWRFLLLSLGGIQLWGEAEWSIFVVFALLWKQMDKGRNAGLSYPSSERDLRSLCGRKSCDLP